MMREHPMDDSLAHGFGTDLTPTCDRCGKDGAQAGMVMGIDTMRGEDPFGAGGKDA